MMKQTDIAKVLKVPPVTVHYILSGKRKVSWPLAERLAELFPGRTIQQWKKAGPEELRRIFEQLKEEKAYEHLDN